MLAEHGGNDFPVRLVNLPHVKVNIHGRHLASVFVAECCGYGLDFNAVRLMCLCACVVYAPAVVVRRAKA